jgi:hypothetical protein
MRLDGSITSISWIPSEAVKGLAKLPFGSGVAHYDAPPPDSIGSGPGTLDDLVAADRLRFANHLAAWVEVDDDGNVVDAGYAGGGRIGSTTLNVGLDLTIAAVALPDRRSEPERGPGWVRFRQTAGGRTGMPAPRHVNRPPFVQVQAPIAWSTLELTIHADGRVEGQLVGASTFPRHWVYDGEGELVAKSGLIDFQHWYRHAFDDHTPWGDLDSPALVTEVESALERELSVSIMGAGHKPRIRKVKADERLVVQGDPGREMFLLLDGVVSVDVDGVELCQIGPGSVMGERSLLDGGHRTATVTAVTPCTIAIVGADEVSEELRRELADLHRREEQVETGASALTEH